jgi:hypothetical protein
MELFHGIFLFFVGAAMAVLPAVLTVAQVSGAPALREAMCPINRPISPGLKIRSVKVTGRRGTGTIEKELQTRLVGQPYTPELHRQAVRDVDTALTKEANQSFEEQLGIDGGAQVDRKTGATFLYITQCAVIDHSTNSIDVIVRVLFLRTDLKDLAANILPLPRSINPSFYQHMPAALRLFNPIFDAAYDRRSGPLASLKLSTNLLALKQLWEGETIDDPNTKFNFDFSGEKALANPFYQSSARTNFDRERPGKLIEQIKLEAAFQGDNQPLAEFRETNLGLQLKGDLKLRPRLGLLNSVYLTGAYYRTNNKVFESAGQQILRQRDHIGAFRALIDGRVWDGFARLGIWVESAKGPETSGNYQKFALIGGFEKEFGKGHQTVGLELLAGTGKDWGAVPLYARYFGGSSSGNFLYDGPDGPGTNFPAGPLLRSYGKNQASVHSTTFQNLGGAAYWHANVNLTIPIKHWSYRLIPDEDVVFTNPNNGSQQVIKLNAMLENFTVKSATNTLTDTLMDDIISNLMKNDPKLTEDEATTLALPIAARQAEKIIGRDVGPTMKFISRHANLYAVKPLLMTDATSMRGTFGDNRYRFAVGGGIQLTMVVARAEFGYLRSVPTLAGEPKGNFVFRLTFQNIF